MFYIIMFEMCYRSCSTFDNHDILRKVCTNCCRGGPNTFACMASALATLHDAFHPPILSYHDAFLADLSYYRLQILQSQPHLQQQKHYRTLPLGTTAHPYLWEQPHSCNSTSVLYLWEQPRLRTSGNSRTAATVSPYSTSGNRRAYVPLGTDVLPHLWEQKHSSNNTTAFYLWEPPLLRTSGN